ncbi:hypothetical protein ACH4T9_12650 [Micromonospora sp. NPDC020750]|uniref:hypothetical protein n=1 Tax=unclassified Micromonospora TaxID=2617518 RepID=UPI00378A7A26
MAGYAFPTTAYNSRAVTPREYEDLMHPMGPDGLIGDPTLPPLVYADSSLLGVKIRADRAALMRGLRWESGDTEVSVPLDANTTPGTSRKDLVVLRMTRNPWNISPAVVKGVEVTTPTTPPPTYGTNTATGVWELPLAEVTVPYNDTVTDFAQCTPKAWYIGSDGQIRCTTDTLPPHEAGRVIWLHPGNRYQVSNGTRWLTAVEDSGLTAVSLLSGYAAGENVVQRVNGICVLNVKVMRTNGTIPAGANTRVGQLPAGFIPTFPVQSAALWWSAAQVVGLRVDPDGYLYVVCPAGVSVGQNRTVDGSLTWIAA